MSTVSTFFSMGPLAVVPAGLDAARSPVARASDKLGGALLPVNPAVQAIIVAYRRLLEEQVGERLVQLILFGSYARGDARVDSDVDVAVVLDRIERPSERTLPMELAADLIV